MSLKFFSGFDAYGGIAFSAFPSAGPHLRWSGGSITGTAEFSASAQRYGSGYGLLFSTVGVQSGSNAVSSTSTLLLNLDGVWTVDGDDLIFQLGINFPEFDAAAGPAQSDTPICSVLSATGAAMLSVFITAGGYLRLYADTNNQGLLATAAVPIAPAAWYTLEWELDNTSGTCTEQRLYVNGVLYLTYTGGIAAALVDFAFNFGSVGTDLESEGRKGGDIKIDNVSFISNDGVGITARLGETRVSLREPDAEVGGQNTNYTRTGGTGVDDSVAVIDGDTSYYAGADVDDQVIFTSTDSLPSTTDVIHGVAITQISRKDGAGARTLAALIRSDSANYEGDAISLSDSYGAYQTVFEEDPDDGGIAWTKARAEASGFGVIVDS